MQFGLAAGLQADIELLAVAHDFLHHLSHLVHLNGVDDEVLGLIFILFGRLLEAAGNFLDTIVKDVGKAQQCRCGDVA